MFFKNICVLVVWMKVLLALEGLVGAITITIITWVLPSSDQVPDRIEHEFSDAR